MKKDKRNHSALVQAERLRLQRERYARIRQQLAENKRLREAMKAKAEVAI